MKVVALSFILLWIFMDANKLETYAPSYAKFYAAPTPSFYTGHHNSFELRITGQKIWNVKCPAEKREDRMKKVSYKVCTKLDKKDIANFLWTMKDEFRFTEQRIIDEIIDLLFEKGGIFAGYQAETVVGMFGYFLGEPSRDYQNKDVGFIYIAGLAKRVRKTMAFRSGVQFTIETLRALNVREIRCHAALDDAYANGLYSRLGRPIGTDINRRGDTCILYASTIDDILAKLSSGKTHRSPA
jgi:hypothetical protein